MKWMCPKCGISLEGKDAKQQHLCGNKAIESAWENFCKRENVQPDDEPLFYEYFRKGWNECATKILKLLAAKKTSYFE